MRVNQCRQCKYYKRKVWSTTYKPNGYHTIGVSHAYGWCDLHSQRCLEIKNCKENK